MTATRRRWCARSGPTTPGWRSRRGAPRRAGRSAPGTIGGSSTRCSAATGRWARARRPTHSWRRARSRSEQPYDRAVSGGDELRAAMRRFPAGVALVTVAVDGQRLGITVGSLVSLSLEPALVGISIGLQSSIYTPLSGAGRFAVNLLSAEQIGLAQHFARSGLPPLVAWSGVALRESPSPEPLVEGALAWLQCTTV